MSNLISTGTVPCFNQNKKQKQMQKPGYTTFYCTLPLMFHTVLYHGENKLRNIMMFFLEAGRGGRKTLSGKRNRVIVYILYNASDIAGNVPGLSAEVREFCTTKDCLKENFQNIILFQLK